MKQMCIERATEWLTNLAEKRDETAHLVNQFLSDQDNLIVSRF